MRKPKVGTFRRCGIGLVLLLVSLSLAGCRGTSEKGSADAPKVAEAVAPSTTAETAAQKHARLAKNGASKQELLAALIERGDTAANDEKDTKHLRARWAYTFATLFDPSNKEVANKLKALGGQVTREESKDVEGSHDAGVRFSMAMMSSLSDANVENLLANYSRLTPEMELVNLRMLLDDRLVGDLAYAPWQIGEGGSQSLLVFIKQPSIRPSELSDTYGQPSAESMADNTTTYGLVRFYGTDCIVLPLERGALPKALAVR